MSSAVSPGAREDRQGGRPLGTERPGPAGETDLLEPGCRERAEGLGGAVPARVQLGRIGAQERRGDARLEVRVGARPLAVGRCRARSDRTTPGSRRSSPRRASASASKAARNPTRRATLVRVARARTSTLGMVHGARWQLVPASRSGAPMRPTIDSAEPGRGCHCHQAAGARTVPLTPTRDQTGGHLGCRSRNQERTIGLEADSSRWISDLDHEPSNWTSAIRPG